MYASTATPLSDDGNSSDDDSNISFDWWQPTLAIAIPAWIGMMADPLLSLMDTAYVGRLGARELAALGACTSIFHLAFNAFRATTTATTTLVASADTDEERKRVTQLSLWLGFGMGWFVLGFLMKSGTWCLARMGIAQGSVLYTPAIEYLTARAWAAPAVLGLVVAEGAFRGYGDMRVPLVASLVAAAINLVLDPVLMFRPIHLGVTGAAAATAVSQAAAFLIYLYCIWKRKMLPKRQEKSKINAWKVIWTIVGANLAMLTKQASLLLGWAYATARATRLGNEHVAAHQVAVSFWLVFALWLDGAAVAAQVLCGQSIHLRRKLKSLTSYMVKLSAAQGLIATGWLLILGRFVPYIFTTDMEIRRHLGSLIPHLAYQQPLISMTLVVESIAAGGQQFSLLAWGTALSTLAAVRQIRVATTVEDIWSRGIVLLFAGRLLTAFVGVARIVGAIPPMPFHFFNNSTRNKYEEGNDQDITEIDQ